MALIADCSNMAPLKIVSGNIVKNRRLVDTDPYGRTKQFSTFHLSIHGGISTHSAF